MNRTYTASIDGGEGGDTTLEAVSLNEALVAAILWALDGDWPEDGCEILVAVEDEDGDEVRETVQVPSTAEKLDTRLEDDGQVLGESEGEWSTEKVILIGGSYYYSHPNGGWKGSHNRQDGDGVWRDRPVESTREIDLSEARCFLLDWGYDPTEVAQKTRD